METSKSTDGAARFTAGPWSYAPSGPKHFGVWKGGEPICCVEGGTYEHEANARLLAAAPALFEALEAIRARLDGEWDHPALVRYGALADAETDIRKIARAALALARGQGGVE